MDTVYGQLSECDEHNLEYYYPQCLVGVDAEGEASQNQGCANLTRHQYAFPAESLNYKNTTKGTKKLNNTDQLSSKVGFVLLFFRNRLVYFSENSVRKHGKNVAGSLLTKGCDTHGDKS